MKRIEAAEAKLPTPAQMDSIVLRAFLVFVVALLTVDALIYDVDGRGVQNTLLGGVGR